MLRGASPHGAFGRCTLLALSSCKVCYNPVACGALVGSLIRAMRPMCPPRSYILLVGQLLIQTPNAAQIPVLVRIEVDTSSFLQFQVTVATPDAAATAAIRNLLCAQIAMLAA